MSTINGIKMYKTIIDEDKKWYSFLKSQMDNLEFGALDLRLTIKSGKVVAVKVTSEKTIQI